MPQAYLMSPEMDAFWVSWAAWTEDQSLPYPSDILCHPYTWRLDREPRAEAVSPGALGYLAPSNEIPYRIWVRPDLSGELYLAVLRHEAIHALARCTGALGAKPEDMSHQDWAHAVCDGPIWGLESSVAQRAKAFRGKECSGITGQSYGHR